MIDWFYNLRSVTQNVLLLFFYLIILIVIRDEVLRWKKK
jgi:hypothetical protein